MKTKDFIKLLQEEDPKGESYLRVNGQPIWFLEGKEGYWDGPYNYLKKGEDNKPNWIQTTEGYKIDITTIDMYDFCGLFNGNWEEVKKHIEVKYTYLENEKHINEFLKYAKNQCELYNEINEIVKNDGNWNEKITNEKWDQLTEYEKHLWLLDNDYEYEKDWYSAIKRNINN